MGSTADHDRLIEEGLALYGQGDLDGALLIWERVLAENPFNEQANSYVDYVRMNYDMLTSDPGENPQAPFGISDDNEPDYQIEISDGELPPVPGRAPAAAPLYMDPTDAGWMIEDEPVSSSNRVVAATMDDLDDADDRPLTLEMEPDEPDEPGERYEVPAIHRAPTPVVGRAQTAPGETFDDATREYDGPRGVPKDFADISTNEFAGEPGTPGFSTPEVTAHRKRDLGFVRPVKTTEPPELKMTLRTPPTTPPPVASRSAFDESFEMAQIELGAPGAQEASAPHDDLIASLPRPTAPITRDMPTPNVRPASSPSISLRPPTGDNVHTRRTAVQKAIDLIDLDLPDPTAEPPVPSASPTREIGDRGVPVSPSAPTRELGQLLQTQGFLGPDPMISAPTRELGLRPGRVPTEDEPTSTNLRMGRDNARDRESAREEARAGTRADIVLAFDPIDARATQILDEVDAQAPAEETKEDRTRRRISTLLERATLWSSVDLERAVAAVDLALGEDPNSALAQKLIHRNRDTIMHVFQAFLGNLDRAPELARPLHELSSAPISPRAAFLLSRVDGTFTLDEILDVSGMPRLEAYRYLAQLFLRGILR